MFRRGTIINSTSADRYLYRKFYIDTEKISYFLLIRYQREETHTEIDL